MTSIKIIDGNNWFRRRAETDVRGNPLRSCYTELQTSPYDVTILTWDGVSALKARREIYPEYKQTRNKPGESFYEVQKTFKQLAQLSKAISIELYGLEADDVIAHLVKRYKPIASKIFIESNDADLAQLGCLMARTEFPIPPEEVALYKTLVGDPSDNIKGVPGFGKGAWEKIDKIHKSRLISILNGYVDWQTWFSPGDLPEKIDKYIRTPENLTQLKKLWRIVNFIPINDKLIDKNITIGLNRPDLAENILQEIFS